MEFDVVGTAGGDPPTSAPAWYDPGWRPTGFVPHADRQRPASAFRPDLIYYGPVPGCCRVLDGHFIATIPSRVHRVGVSFDEQFAFHHYDLDFCDRVRAAGLRVGTWPIWVLHGGGGNYFSHEWQESAEKYLSRGNIKASQAALGGTGFHFR